MLSLIFSDKCPLENPEVYPYSQICFDGAYFYCCTGKSCKVYKLNCDGKLEDCIDTVRVYSSICFDCEENCFWAITQGSGNLIFKLNDCFFEVGSISLPRGDRLNKSISYDMQNDMLLLCDEKTVYKASKSGALFPHYSGDIGTGLDAVSQIFDNLLINCNFRSCCPNIIAALYPNFCFDYVTCMPKGFVSNGFCVGYGCDNSAVLFVLSTQNYRHSYLIKYRVESGGNCRKCGSDHDFDCPAEGGMIDVHVDCTDIRADVLI